jgi:hypothetical protein
MKGRSRILAILALLLLAAVSFQLTSLLGSGKADRERSETNARQHEGKESPPEDWFITQRVTHGGIPAGALEKAGAEAAALAATTLRSDPQLAGAAWKFLGPTNNGGRVVDIAVDPVAADTITWQRLPGHLEEHGPGRSFHRDLAGDEHAIDGCAYHHSSGTLFAGTGRGGQSGRRQHRTADRASTDRLTAARPGRSWG